MKLQNLLGKIKAKLFPERRVIKGYSEHLSCSDGVRKRALLSYLVAPLIPRPAKRNHADFTNHGKAQYMARALNELGYVVDIVNIWDTEFIPEDNYDLFVGHGGINFERIHRSLKGNPTCIYFSTGMYWKSSNEREYERLMDAQRRRGIWLFPDRYIHHSEEYANERADAIIALGNDQVRKSYEKFDQCIILNNAAFPLPYKIPFRDFSKARNRFLFFSGSGNLHKGLDLLLEAFDGLAAELFVCQELQPEFEEEYKELLFSRPNIQYMGWILRRSAKFLELAGACAFVISPTCAEGSQGALIECMAHGLIPIATPQCTVDIKGFGIQLSASVGSIKRTVETWSNKDPDILRTHSERTLETVRTCYTPDVFLLNFKAAVASVVENSKNKKKPAPREAVVGKC